MLAVVSSIGFSQGDESSRVKVVTTLNFLKSLTQEVGGERVSVECLTNPKQDPHYLTARPSFKKIAQEADLFVYLGLGLDNWARDVAVGSGNPKIQPGAEGWILASRNIRTTELPDTLSRAWGDLHPEGNPHIWLDPINGRIIAENICDALCKKDPANRETYQNRLKEFQHRLDVALFGEELLKKKEAKTLLRKAMDGTLDEYIQNHKLQEFVGGWLKKAAPLKGISVLTYHKTYIYLANRFGFNIVGEIEEKPGIEPTQKYLDQLVEKSRNAKVKLIVVDLYYPLNKAEFVAEKIGAKVVKNSTDVGGFDEDKTYIDWIDNTITRMVAALK